MAQQLTKIPEKIYYTISEVSSYTGVETHVLRYWETKFSKLSPKRVGGNQRKYTRRDLELIFSIIELLYNEGYTLDGAEKKLREVVPRKEKTITVKPPEVLHPTNGDLDRKLAGIKRELKSILELVK